jgi:hypothetical protein
MLNKQIKKLFNINCSLGRFILSFLFMTVAQKVVAKITDENLLGPYENQSCYFLLWVCAGNTEGGSITVQLTSCLTGLDSSVL